MSAQAPDGWRPRRLSRTDVSNGGIFGCRHSCFLILQHHTAPVLRCAMLLMSRIVKRITYSRRREALCVRHPGMLNSTTLCERRSENQGSMPLSSLNRSKPDRQMVWNAAWQRWIGLPEGASFRPRLNHFTNLSHPSRISTVVNLTSARAPVSPCTGASRAFMRQGTNWPAGQLCGLAEDGVSHADALLPAGPHVFTSPRQVVARAAKDVTLVIFALAAIPKASSM